MIGFAGVTVVAVAALLAASAYGHKDIAAACKIAASCGFLLTAWRAGAFESVYGRAIFVGLVLSWFGDVFLMSSAKSAFLAGLIAFLLAHIAYCAAFAVRGMAWSHTAGSLVVLIPFIALILWWLMPHVEGPMRLPVLVYAVVITAMVAAAAGMLPHSWGLVILAGATLFYVSDLFVARDRFVQSDSWNTRIGLPLYYAGQILVALSIYPLKR